MKQKILSVIIALIFTLILISCKNSSEPGLLDDSFIYQNSFESASDTLGWGGHGMIGFRNDPSPEGGKQSLYVSGGCLVPHAEFKIQPQSENGCFVLQGWGKNLDNGGFVELHIADSVKSISFDVSDKEWKFYQSADTLYCPANLQFKLNMISGGLVSSSMLVDQIRVKRVE